MIHDTQVIPWEKPLQKYEDQQWSQANQFNSGPQIYGHMANIMKYIISIKFYKYD